METMTKSTWLAWASLIVTILVILYMALHISSANSADENREECLKAQEVKFLDKTQLNVITVLINNSNVLLSDSSKNAQELKALNNKKEQKTRALIIDFLKENFDLKDGDENTVINRIMTTNFKDLQAILPTYPIYINSFFWLTSPGILLEIIFWSLFGLMASLLFGVTSSEVFDPKLIPEHIGKFFYTPFLVIVIYLSLNALTNEGAIVLEGEGKGTIVLAFVLGFYTRRAIVLLGKIKDIILPAKDREPWTIQVPANKDRYKELKVEDQKVVIDNFLKEKFDGLLKKYPNIKLIAAALKPATNDKRAYYFAQISLKEGGTAEGIPSSFEYTDSNKVVYQVPAEALSA